jgi:UDP-2,4-diacetamido-2,4,6-trideoxy-beta-L-altropyranose hydrolase
MVVVREEMTSVRALIRCDASPLLGAGHVMRCMAFAETLAWAGWLVTFATCKDSLAVAPALTASGHDIRIIDGDRVDAGDDTRLILVDHYGLDSGFEQMFAGSGHTVLVFDDLADRPHACDILVDPTPGRAASDYRGRIPDTARVLLGSRHAIIRRVWLRHRTESMSRLSEAGPVERIVVSMGATDPKDTTSRVLAAVVASGVRAHVDVVLGTGAPHLSRVSESIRPGMTLHVDPPNLPELVAKADLAIGAPGSSSFERAVIGLPAIMIANADNQRFIAAAFAEAGAADLLPMDVLDDPVAFGEKIAALVENSVRRLEMSRAARAITDGRGAMRLLAAIAGEMEAKGIAKVRLRLAEAEDEDWLLELQRHPGTRRHFLNPAVPTTDQHHAWMQRTLADPETLLAIVEADERRSGMVRLDRKRSPDATPTYDVSIAIDPAQHGRGIGTAALALARRIAPNAVLDATVLPENIASLQLFRQSGYLHDGGNLFRSLPQ